MAGEYGLVTGKGKNGGTAPGKGVNQPLWSGDLAAVGGHKESYGKD